MSDDDMDPREVETEAHIDEGEEDTYARREEEVEDEEEEDEEEEENAGRRKRPKHRHKRDAAARFLDIEAEVSDEDEESDVDDDEDAAGFISNHEGDDDEPSSRRHHAALDAQRHFEEEDRSPEQIAKDLSERYSGRTSVRYTGDMNEIPQRLLMPSVHDASLWQVRVKPGRERDIVFSLMRKSIDVEYTARPLQILSAFQRDSLPGMIYVEARSSQQVLQACHGLVGVYASRGVHLVPIEEMASLLQIKKQEVNVTPGSWVRIRRGNYAGDLAQVMDITENGETLGLKLLPRIDLNPRDDASLDGGRKRKKTAAGAMRPPQRLFNYEEVIKAHGRHAVSKRNHVYVFQGETYKDGFMEKDFKLNNVILEDVNPSLDEITQFSRHQEGDVDDSVDLSIIAEASRKAAISVLQPGDHVEVFEGEQAGVHGVVEEISQDVVTITAAGVDLEGQKVDLPARSVRKRFKPGDHVKVMAGKNADETGLVVSVSDNVVTFISDMSMQEVSVFSKDLREAAEVGSGTNIVGNYELHDLVQLDVQTVGVIFKTERDSFRVLDQNGQVRLVQPHQISMRRDSARAVATDSEGHEIRVNDNMREIDGEGRRGHVLHLHQSFFAFLYNREITENGGVFVARARSLASAAPKGMKTSIDLSVMNPSMTTPVGGIVGSGNIGRGPRDRHIGLHVVVVKGPHKGYIGKIKDTNRNIARVELNTGNKLISIDKSKIHRRPPDGNGPLDGPWDRKMGPPAPNSFAKTPNPYTESSRTPAWNASSRTPNPYAQTPAWNASSRTPNPYANGGQTPAWNASSRTPNPYQGGATPGRPTWGASGGATPARGWGNNDGWATPGRGWGTDATWSAPTPAASAETPAFNAAPTPAASGPTPAAYYTTPTPGYPAGGFSAPTPSVSGISAPTPALGFGSWDDATQAEYYELPEDWLLDPVFAPIQKRLKIKIEGTRSAQYLDGKYEGKTGRVMGAQRAAANFDQTAMVEFDDGEARSVLAKYIVPVYPEKSDIALVLHGRSKGKTVKVQMVEGRTCTCMATDSSSWADHPKDVLCVLTGED